MDWWGQVKKARGRDLPYDLGVLGVENKVVENLRIREKVINKSFIKLKNNNFLLPKYFSDKYDFSQIA